MSTGSRIAVKSDLDEYEYKQQNSYKVGPRGVNTGSRIAVKSELEGCESTGSRMAVKSEQEKC